MLDYYLDPWCKIPKELQALDGRAEYVLKPTLVWTKKTNFSMNLYASNNIPAPCNRKKRSKKNWEWYMSPKGVPWKWNSKINEDNLKDVNKYQQIGSSWHLLYPQAYMRKDLEINKWNFHNMSTNECLEGCIIQSGACLHRMKLLSPCWSPVI